ncbi:MAG: hypothetical protein AAGD32_16895 [Planctomycetota bacterium]
MKILMITLAALLTAVLATTALAIDEAGKSAQITLEKRVENGPYKNSAYSFRQETHDVAIHKNYVDLLLNRCGLIHISPVSGMSSRVTDLGEMPLAASPDVAPDNADWHTEWIEPVIGHVYLQQIEDGPQTMIVKYHIDEVHEDAVKLTWTVIQPFQGPERAPNAGAAGTKGQCGGPHEDK